MASRAKKKRTAQGGSATEGTGATDAAEASEKSGEPIAGTIFCALLFFGAGACAGIALLDSWLAALICGALAAGLGTVLVRSGATLS